MIQSSVPADVVTSARGRPATAPSIATLLPAKGGETLVPSGVPSVITTTIPRSVRPTIATLGAPPAV